MTNTFSELRVGYKFLAAPTDVIQKVDYRARRERCGGRALKSLLRKKPSANT